jgi:hypothetical protein
MIDSGVWEMANGAGGIGGIVAAGCACYVAFRDGKRLKSGEAKALEERIDRAQNTADRWIESSSGKDLVHEIRDHGGRIAGCEQQLTNVATKTDVAHLQGAIDTVKTGVGTANKAAERIEGMLMRRALGVSE